MLATSGSAGVNHGIELHEDVVDYAEKHLAQMLSSPGAIDLCDFAIPQFVVGNALLLDPSLMGTYDRVYCGAGVSPRYHRFVCRYLSGCEQLLICAFNGFNLVSFGSAGSVYYHSAIRCAYWSLFKLS
jgi:hypothetical protein